MKFRSITQCAGILGACIALTAPVAAQTLYDNYQVPKNTFGQPDLQGTWTNVSLTPITRSKELGNRAVFTDDEVLAMEQRVELEVEEGLRPTDPNADAEYRPESQAGLRSEFSAAGGDVGGYNRFWLNPGDTVMRVGGEPRTSVLTTPDGQIPLTKDGKPARRFYSRYGFIDRFTSYETMSLGERCIIGFGRNAGPPMFANGFYNNNYQIVQGPEHVMILVEMNHDVRLIRLNEKHYPGDARPYFGDSVGRWEGNTLVVETINIPESQAFYGSWENLKVTERFTRVSENRLHYAFTVEDPSIWAKPWGGEYEFSPLDGDIFEYACHEGNYALPGMLKGARYEEAKKAEKK